MPETPKAKWLNDPDGNQFYPVSHAKAAVRGNSTVDSDLSSLETDLSSHKSGTPAGTGGVHGITVSSEGVIQFPDGNGGQLSIPGMIDLNSWSVRNHKLYHYPGFTAGVVGEFDDPVDSRFTGAMIRCKSGSYPTSLTDGVLVSEFTVAEQGHNCCHRDATIDGRSQTTPNYIAMNFIVSQLTPDTTTYFRVFPKCGDVYLLDYIPDNIRSIYVYKAADIEARTWGVKIGFNIASYTDQGKLTNSTLYPVITRTEAAENLTGGDAFDDFTPWKRRRCIVADDGTILAFWGEKAYTPYGKLKIPVYTNGKWYPSGTNCQVMVYQPKFYFTTRIHNDHPEYNQGLTAAANGEGNEIDQTKVNLTGVDDSFDLGNIEYLVSDLPLSDMIVHPAFINKNGDEVPYILLSAYEGSMQSTIDEQYHGGELSKDWTDSANSATAQRNTAGTPLHDFGTLSSVAGVIPVTGGALIYSGNANTFNEVTRKWTPVEAKRSAAMRGNNWGISTLSTIGVSQLLFLIEYATLNMSKALSPSDGSVYYVGIEFAISTSTYSQALLTLCGLTESMGNKTGVVPARLGIARWANTLSEQPTESVGDYQNNATMQQVAWSYRGEENLTGNAGNMVDVWREINCNIQNEAEKLYNTGVGRLYLKNDDGTREYIGFVSDRVENSSLIAKPYYSTHYGRNYGTANSIGDTTDNLGVFPVHVQVPNTGVSSQAEIANVWATVRTGTDGTGTGRRGQVRNPVSSTTPVTSVTSDSYHYTLHSTSRTHAFGPGISHCKRHPDFILPPTLPGADAPNQMGKAGSYNYMLVAQNLFGSYDFGVVESSLSPEVIGDQFMVFGGYPTEMGAGTGTHIAGYNSSSALPSYHNSSSKAFGYSLHDWSFIDKPHMCVGARMVFTPDSDATAPAEWITAEPVLSNDDTPVPSATTPYPYSIEGLDELPYKTMGTASDSSTYNFYLKIRFKNPTGASAPTISGVTNIKYKSRGTAASPRPTNVYNISNSSQYFTWTSTSDGGVLAVNVGRYPNYYLYAYNLSVTFSMSDSTSVSVPFSLFSVNDVYKTFESWDWPRLHTNYFTECNYYIRATADIIASKSVTLVVAYRNNTNASTLYKEIPVHLASGNDANTSSYQRNHIDDFVPFIVSQTGVCYATGDIACIKVGATGDTGNQPRYYINFSYLRIVKSDNTTSTLDFTETSTNNLYATTSYYSSGTFKHLSNLDNALQPATPPIMRVLHAPTCVDDYLILAVMNWGKGVNAAYRAFNQGGGSNSGFYYTACGASESTSTAVASGPVRGQGSHECGSLDITPQEAAITCQYNRTSGSYSAYNINNSSTASDYCQNMNMPTCILSIQVTQAIMTGYNRKLEFQGVMNFTLNLDEYFPLIGSPENVVYQTFRDVGVQADAYRATDTAYLFWPASWSNPAYLEYEDSDGIMQQVAINASDISPYRTNQNHVLIPMTESIFNGHHHRLYWNRYKSFAVGHMIQGHSKW